MRPPCILCVLKHLGQAAVLIEEAELGYPLHRWLAIGHMAEASAESLQEWPHLAHLIRDARKLYEEEEIIDIMALIKEADSVAESEM